MLGPVGSEVDLRDVAVLRPERSNLLRALQ
jgi:hypothetical protein